MKTIAVGKYLDFQCLAGACPQTCCAGFRIRIDEKDYKRFEELEPEWLQKDILNSVQKREDGYYFCTDKQGNCAMLDEDGLCRIQRHTSEEVLCNTCRKYPRLVNTVEDCLYLSMAASCPVISEYLVKESVIWVEVEGQKTEKVLCFDDMLLVHQAWLVYQRNKKVAMELQQKNNNADVLYSCFEKMAAHVLDIIIKYHDMTLQPEMFQILEENCSSLLKNFLVTTQKLWGHVAENYVKYRIPSRRIEFPEENDSQCIRQAMGELFLLRTLLFCSYANRQEVTEVLLSQLLRKVYRFSAHGKKIADAFDRLLEEFFKQDILWYYILL